MTIYTKKIPDIKMSDFQSILINHYIRLKQTNSKFKFLNNFMSVKSVGKCDQCNHKYLLRVAIHNK